MARVADCKERRGTIYPGGSPVPCPRNDQSALVRRKICIGRAGGPQARGKATAVDSGETVFQRAFLSRWPKLSISLCRRARGRQIAIEEFSWETRNIFDSCRSGAAGTGTSVVHA